MEWVSVVHVSPLGTEDSFFRDMKVIEDLAVAIIDGRRGYMVGPVLPAREVPEAWFAEWRVRDQPKEDIGRFASLAAAKAACENHLAASAGS
jgi:hypothetical protein